MGVPSEDDDGAGATQRSKPKFESLKVNATPITTPQIEVINDLRALAGLTVDRLTAGVKKASAGDASTVDKLSEHEAVKLIEMLNQIIETEK